MIEPMDDLERRTLAAMAELDNEDRNRALLVIAAMRAGIEINPADLHGKSPEELRQFADRLREQLEASGSAH